MWIFLKENKSLYIIYFIDNVVLDILWKYFHLFSDGLLNNDLSDLLIKTDLPDENSLAVKVELPEEINDEQTLTNPPPSPATDQDTPPPPRDQDFLTYSDVEEDSDCLEIETEMDLL